MDHVSVLLEHVDLLDGLDGLDVHLLECRLELLVVGAGRLVDLLHLAAGGTLSTVHGYISAIQYDVSQAPIRRLFASRVERRICLIYHV